MRKALFLLLGFPAAAVFLVALFLALRNLRDERPDAAVVAALANRHAAVPPSANLYFELLAFDVRDAAAPAEVGRAMVARYLEARRRRASPAYDWNVDPDFVRGAFTGDLAELCTPDPARAPCLEGAASGAAALRTLVDANRWLLERYRQSMAYRQLEYPLPQAPDSPLPTWKSFMAGKHLLLSEIALGSVAGRGDEEAVRLREDALFTRRLLAEQDITLIDKMVLAAAYRQDLLLAAEMLRARPLSRAALRAILELAAPVTEAERSLAGPYGREFEMTAAMLTTLADPAHADQFVSSEGARSGWARLAGHATRFFYQPNASLNLAWRQTRAMQDAADRPCEAQSHGAATADPPPPDSLLEGSYNPIGRAVLRLSGFAYDAYPHRLCELVKLQRLVALHAAIKDAGTPDAGIPAFIAAGGAAYRDPLSGRPFRFDASQRAFDVQFADRGFVGLSPWKL